MASLIKWELSSPYSNWQTVYNGWRITRLELYYVAIHPNFWWSAIDKDHLEEASFYHIRNVKLPILLEEIDNKKP